MNYTSIVKKILLIIISITLVITMGVGMAFAIWHIDVVQYTDSRSLSVMKDDIFENYDIKKVGDDDSNQIKTYTIYLYPSTLYLNDYLDYLNGETEVLPEEKYGYIEPSVGIDGNISYHVHSVGGDTEYLRDLSQNSDIVAPHGSSSVYSFINYVYDLVYREDDELWAEWNSVDSSLPSTSQTWYNIGTYNKSLPSNLKHLYGDPILDTKMITYQNTTVSGDTIDSMSDGERHNWRNLHYYDRFGYWPTLAKDDGRYLPIKIEVDVDFSNSYYKTVALTPFSDMSDPHGWFVYSFTCWSYVKHNEDGTWTAPYYATDAFANANSGTAYVDADGKLNASLSAFCPTEVSQCFDIIENFDQYADENGIIRLFPKFSNGKGYNASDVKNGGGDAIKVVPTYKDENGEGRASGLLDQHELFSFYNSESAAYQYTYRNWYGGTSTATLNDIRVSILPNVDIDKYTSLLFRHSGCYGSSASWGTWESIYDFSSSDISDIIDNYGAGIYNIYLFVGNVMGAKDSRDATSALEALRTDLVNKEAGEAFSSLSGKNLLPVKSFYINNRSFMIVVEKVREAKCISNLALTDDQNKYTSSVYDTEQNIKNKYNSEETSFRLINNTLLGYKGDEETEVQDEFPYCYILQNVDFTEATTPYFQIRFQENYRSDLNFVSSGYKYDTIKFAGQMYEHGFGNYFELVEIPINGSSQTQKCLKLLSEEMRGVYDIILIFRPNTTDSTIAFDIGVYAFRHTNVFLKVFTHDISSQIQYYDEIDGAQLIDADHPLPEGKTAQSFIDHNVPGMIYAKSYPIGVSIKGTDVNDALGGGEYTLARSVNEALKDMLGDDSPENVVLKDHVTGAIVGRYIEAASLDPDQVQNGYYYTVGSGTDVKYYELVFEKFKVRKNYIFFISLS